MMRTSRQSSSSPAQPASAAAQRRSSDIEPIGLLGGSFDPVHVGHLQLARDARDRLGLAEVRLIPAAQPWQKGPITDAAQRAHMVALAIAGERGLALDMREIERGGPSYTIDTLRALRASLGPARPLVLVIGADQMARLDTWREWQALLDYAHLAVAHRNASPPALNPTLRAFAEAHHAESAALHARPHGAVVDLPMTPVDAAATAIRALLSAPPSPAREARLRALVPAPVLLYIRQQGLYAPPARLAAREKEKPELMDLQKLQRLVVEALEDVKAQDILVFNTVGLSDMFDRVILASGTSNRQSRALAWSVVEKVKQAGGQVVSVEGTDPGEWVLVDLGDIVVHIMQPAIREYYGLEEMWGAKPVKVKLAAQLRGNRPDRDELPAASPESDAGAASPSAARALAAAPVTPVAATRKRAASKAPVAKNAARKTTARPSVKPSTKAVKPAAKGARKGAAKAAAKPAAKAAPRKTAALPRATPKAAPSKVAAPKARTKAVAKRTTPAASAAAKPARKPVKKTSAAKPAAKSVRSAAKGSAVGRKPVRPASAAAKKPTAAKKSATKKSAIGKPAAKKATPRRAVAR